MDFSYYLQYLLSGLTNGSIYAILAIGFIIIYNSTGIINFAQGEFVMLGGMLAITFTNGINIHLPEFLKDTVFFFMSSNELIIKLPMFFSIILSVLITGIIGSLVYIFLLRWIPRPTVLRMIIITIGVSIVMKEIALLIWGEKVRALPYFVGNEVTSIQIFGAFISPQVLWVIGISLFIVVLLNLYFHFTLQGKAMSACSANLTGANLVGINSKKMITRSFFISASLGALAGCIISPITQTQYNIGSPLAIKGFTVAILGGLGNTTGAIYAGLLLGVIESFSINFIPVVYRDVIAILILLIILVIKPSGIFGKKNISSLKEF